MKTKDMDISEESHHDLAGGELKEAARRELAAGVLKQAVEDLRRFHNSNTKIEREFYFDAYSWVMSDDCSWPFSFLNVCGVLKRAPEELRHELTGELSLGMFGRWFRRCHYAARCLTNSVTQHFATEQDASVPQSSQLLETWH